jgi:hypothetical protein
MRDNSYGLLTQATKRRPQDGRSGHAEESHELNEIVGLAILASSPRGWDAIQRKLESPAKFALSLFRMASRH